MSQTTWGRRLEAATRFLRRVRDAAGRRLPRHRPRANGVTYVDWVCRYDTPDAGTVAALNAVAKAMVQRPRLSVLLPVDDGDVPFLERTLESVRDQIYPEWELCVAMVASAQATVAERLTRVFGDDSRLRLDVVPDTDHPTIIYTHALRLATGTLFGVLQANDELSPHALLCVAREVNAHPETVLVYSDEDEIDERGTRHSPRFKPDFNRELLLSSAYIGRLAFFSTQQVRGVCSLDGSLVDDPDGGLHTALPVAHEFDLVLRLVETVPHDAMRHVPRVLYHRRRPPSPPTTNSSHGDVRSVETKAAIVRRHLDRRNIAARVTPADEWPAGLRITYLLPETPPHVTIIIPTRNEPELLRACVEGLLTKTRYAAYDIVIVDNGSDDNAALAYLARLRSAPQVTVLRDDRPFNWAALNNAAAARATGALLCLLNSDVEILTPDWLDEMVGHALQPQVGAVGARLWYPDKTLQHGGVILYPGAGASHLNTRLPRGAPGHLARAVLTQNVSAVTGACLVVRTAVFAEVGGVDEAFPVDFNDVDFCLRLLARGYRNVWTPYAELLHHETATRGPYEAGANRRRFAQALDRFVDRWGPLVVRDPAFNPNLSPTTEEPPLAWPPRLPPLAL